MKETRKSVPILVQGFFWRGVSRDLICIIEAYQIDKNWPFMCLTSFQLATANVSKDRPPPTF